MREFRSSNLSVFCFFLLITEGDMWDFFGERDGMIGGGGAGECAWFCA